MRVVHAAALTAAALFAWSRPPQGLGDAAAAARRKRKAEPSKPTKVYTEGDIGQAMAPVSTSRDLPGDEHAGHRRRTASNRGLAGGRGPASRRRPTRRGGSGPG